MLPPRTDKLTHHDRVIMEEAMFSFMKFAPFFSYYFYDKMELYYTFAVKTCATDGKRIFVNPAYFSSLKPMERCFALAHEVYHVIYVHPRRMGFYGREGTLKGLPFIRDLFNTAADYVINADLIASKIGRCNPAWLYDPDIKGNELAEDVYVKLYKKLPPPPPPPPGGQPQPDCPPGGGGGQGQPPQPNNKPQPTTGSASGQQQGQPQKQQMPTPKTYGEATGNKGGQRDEQAQANDGRFDEVMAPHEDPATGEDDLPSEAEFREAVQRAMEAAKRAGKMPGNLERLVREIVEPQVQWKEILRLKIVGKVGNRRESWDHPNRRRIVLNPRVYMPGKQGHGAELVTVVIDNSGSITDKELTVFFSETAAILADCKPKRVQVIWCDAAIRRVEEARSLDELLHIRNAPGGGGTSFHPPFQYLQRERIQPDTLVYLTDMMPQGGWPDEPQYPVIWCATTDIPAPWGESVRIKV